MQTGLKVRVAQAFRWTIKLATLLKTIVHLKNKLKICESKQNSLEQYCQQHCRICKPAVQSGGATSTISI
jgi:hypothetical protein